MYPDAATNQLTLFAAIFVGAMVILSFALPRRLLFIPLLITACYAPPQVQFVLAGAHFPIIRVVILAAWCRLLARNEFKGLMFNSMDRLFLWWVIVSVFMGWLMKPNMNFMFVMGFAYGTIVLAQHRRLFGTSALLRLGFGSRCFVHAGGELF